MGTLLAMALTLQIASGAGPSGTVTAAWDPNTDGVTTGYQLSYGTVAGGETTILDVGAATFAVVSGLTPGTTYFFVVRAYNAAKALSGPSNEPSFTIPGTPPDPRCGFPLGDRSVFIIFTGAIGSGLPGSKVVLNYQIGSPNSPIVHTAVKINGVEMLPTGDGPDVGVFGSMWALVPAGPGVFNFSLYARNAYGCSKDQPTTFTIVVPGP